MAPMGELLQKTCPSCRARRIGSFRWCRECGFDFDSLRDPGPDSRPPFALAPPGEFTPAPRVIPAAPAAGVASTEDAAPADRRTAAAAVPADGPIAPDRERRSPLLFVAVVVLVTVVGATGALILLQPHPFQNVAASDTPPGSGSTVAGVVATPPFQPIVLSGDGPATAQFSVPEESSGIATIVNDADGPFSVWSLAAGGTKQDLLVDVAGAYAGMRFFEATDHSVAFAVESDGSWSIEVRPLSDARSWDATDPLFGNESAVVSVVPRTSAKAEIIVIYDGDGAFALSALTAGGRQHLIDEIGAFRDDVVLPTGTYVLEIDADAAWSITPD
jgi:hypothetical protein